MLSIIIIEDDVSLAQIMGDYLGKHNYSVSYAENGVQGIQFIQNLNPDLVILDIMMPELDGLSVCKKIRSDGFDGKILFLTASNDDRDQVAALEMGADDFVSKPIDPRVLLARVRALVRRASLSTQKLTYAEPDVLQYGGLKLHKGRSQAWLDNELLSLANSEFALLWLLASTPDQSISREVISMKLRGLPYDGMDRSIDNKILNLRKKLGDTASLPKMILTVRGKGYLFASE